jgi:hypothetical protein
VSKAKVGRIWAGDGASGRAEGEEVRRGRKIRRWFAWFAAGLMVAVLCLGVAVWVGALAVFDYVMIFSFSRVAVGLKAEGK